MLDGSVAWAAECAGGNDEAKKPTPAAQADGNAHPQ
jgi:hypothetical protein